MGAGRKAARGMKAWLGLRDTEEAASADAAERPDERPDERPFGIPRRERGYARLRIV
jgi:glutamate synthase (NADPH/NADH) small chain